MLYSIKDRLNVKLNYLVSDIMLGMNMNIRIDY